MWKWHISYVLTHERTLYTLTTSRPEIVEENDGDAVKKREKWMKDYLMTRATLLHSMKDNIIPLFEGHEIAKEIMDALEEKYGHRSDTHIQLLLDKYNSTHINEDDYVGDFVNQMELIAKKPAYAKHPIFDKMQVTTILNGLSLSWEHVITLLTHSGKDISIISLPVLLVLEEERMKRRRREGQTSNLMMTQAQNPHAPTFKGKPKKFKKKWKGKLKGKKKVKGACFKCGKGGHFKVNCPKNNSDKKQKEIAMTVTEVMMAEPTSNSWWIDLAATRHITRDREFFVDFKEKAVGEHKVYMGNNTYSDVLDEGKCKIFVKRSIVVLHNVLYVSNIRRNIIYVPVLDGKGYGIKFKFGKVYISKWNVSVKGIKIENMYLLKVDNKVPISQYSYVSKDSSFLWNLRLGHINKNKMKRMSKNGLLPNINSEDFNICESCIQGKMISKSFSKHWKSSYLLEVIHSDICGPLRTKTHKGMEYFITFTDDYSRYGHIYLIKHKSETIEKFKEYKLEAKKQLGRSIKSLNNDREVNMKP
jgi:hypothetical protein